MKYDENLVEVDFTLNGKKINRILLPSEEIEKTPFRREPVAIAIKNALDCKFIEPMDEAKEVGDVDIFGTIICVNGPKIDITLLSTLT